MLSQVGRTISEKPHFLRSGRLSPHLWMVGCARPRKRLRAHQTKPFGYCQMERLQFFFYIKKIIFDVRKSRGKVVPKYVCTNEDLYVSLHRIYCRLCIVMMLCVLCPSALNNSRWAFLYLHGKILFFVLCTIFCDFFWIAYRYCVFLYRKAQGTAFLQQ